MSDLLVNSDYLTNIADAIRDKDSSVGLLTIDDMPTAISNLGGGGGTREYVESTYFQLKTNQVSATSVNDCFKLFINPHIYKKIVLNGSINVSNAKGRTIEIMCSSSSTGKVFTKSYTIPSSGSNICYITDVEIDLTNYDFDIDDMYITLIANNYCKFETATTVKKYFR